MRLIIAILLFVSIGFAQVQVAPVQEMFIHKAPIVLSDSIHADTTYMYWIQFPGRRGNNLLNVLTRADTTSDITAAWDTNNDALWSGYSCGDIKFTGAGALDSLQIKIYAIDKNGYVPVNDYVWATTGTPPGFQTTVSYLSFTTALSERFDISGAFGDGTFGLLIYIIQTNESTTDVALMNFNLYHN